METVQNTKKKSLGKILATLAIVAVVIVLGFMCANMFKNLKGKPIQEKPTTAFPSELKTQTSSFPSVAVTPTTAPLLGPGQYACDPLGICNSYQDAIGRGCPKTYADPYCLGACGDTTVRCPK